MEIVRVWGTTARPAPRSPLSQVCREIYHFVRQRKKRTAYTNINKNHTRSIQVPQSRIRTDVSGLYPLQLSLVIGSYVKMLVPRVLSDRYTKRQEQFQYQGVEK